MDASHFPPWLLYHQRGVVTHSYQVLTVLKKRVESFHQCYFSLCCEMLTALLLYCETIRSGVECSLKTTCLSSSPLAVESRLHSSFSIITAFSHLRCLVYKHMGRWDTRVKILDLLKTCSVAFQETSQNASVITSVHIYDVYGSIVVRHH